MRIRKKLLFVHRWLGIVLATILVTAGITGSLLVFHHELDAWLNPQLHRVTITDQRAALDDIATTIESRYPHLVVGYFLFNDHPAASLHVIMNPREAALEGRLDRDTPRPTEVYADPYSGRILGERNWGEIGWSSAHVMPMIYRFHMSLFLGKAGQWITGIVAGLWMLGILLGMVLAIPSVASLRHAINVKWRASRARVVFDLHRSIGLVAGLLLFITAFTGMYMNLPTVIEPVLAAVAPFTERPASIRPAGAPLDEVWRIGWDAAYRAARATHPQDPLAGIGKIEGRGHYQVRFMPSGDIMDSGTIRVFVDGRNGAVRGKFDHRDGTVGDKIRTWQFPLHSGQGFGLAGRVLVCVLGLIPLLLAITGIWLWLRRRRLQQKQAAINVAPAIAIASD